MHRLPHLRRRLPNRLYQDGTWCIGMKRLFGIMLVVFTAITGSANAQDNSSSSLYPAIPKALGDPHPEGNDFMRINHMKLMRHDRDEVVRLGNREIEYSIKECVACHVVSGPDALPISVENDQHFCRTCHEYAAVKIDCFQCHNSKPDEKIQIRLLGSVPDPEELAKYVNEVSE